MNLTDEGIERIEAHADKEHNALVMLMCQIIREVREVKALLQHSYNSCYGGNDCAGSTDNSKNKHS